ncbi:MAG: hypothetical protein GDA43_26390 [Hormoscilla sp. SP5CHS1]|nr:hypothetical protein [Hormoscilla sp. SP12CHS1]MBC6456253.1 hypothetical protein [Hormoscilla sp. SP5CHS1]
MENEKFIVPWLRYARGSASTLLGLLCYLTWYWQEDFRPFASNMYEPYRGRDLNESRRIALRGNFSNN